MPHTGGDVRAADLGYADPMALGPSVPAWRALADELATLCDRTGARQAVVMDAFNDLWCRASPLRDPQEAFDALARAIDSAKKPLRAGGRVDLTEAHVRAVSFAAVYVLLLFFDGEYQPAWVNAAVRRALPTIESLTTSLPPPEGTDPHAEARAQRQG